MRLIVLLFLISGMLQAAQDDLYVILRSPYSLFDGNRPNQTGFLTDFTFRGGFGRYFVSPNKETWQFKSYGDMSVVSFGENGLWRVGIGLEGIADDDNNIGFRIAQSLYEFFTAVEWRLGPGVIYGGYRHRCKHGIDNTDTRIVMRSGPELGYNLLRDFGPFRLIWNNQLDVFITGQNKDTTSLARGFLGSAAQVEYAVPGNWIKLFASAGLGLMLLSDTKRQDTEGFESSGNCVNKFGNGCGAYSLSTPGRLYVDWTPAGAFGVQFLGSVGDLRVYTSVHRNTDNGFTQEVRPNTVASLNFEFVL